MSRPGSYLGTHGYTIYKDCLCPDDLLQLRRELTVQPKTFGAPVAPDPFTIYLENDAKIYIPRYFGLKEYGTPDADRLSKPIEITCCFKGDLRSHQKPIVTKYLESTTQTGGGGLLDIPCGYGKTACALYIISRLKVKTLVIVHKSFLLEQWIERITQFLPTAKVGRIQGQVIDVDGCDIVIGMLQSLCMKTYPKSTFEGIGLLVVDECHHIPSEVFSRAMLKVVTKYTLGLSATMTRKDGLTSVLKMFLGEVVYKLKREKNPNVVVKSISFNSCDSAFLEPIVDYRGKELHSSMITKLCDYDARNKFLYKVITKEFDLLEGQQILVLSQNKSLLVYLKKMLNEHSTLTSGFYVGGMKRADLDESETKDIILATYGMAAEGLDIVGLTTLVLATPRTDITQAVGRIFRTVHDRPLVVDIVDPHQCFKNQAAKRNKFYSKNNYNITYSCSESYPLFNQGKVNKKENIRPTRCLIKISD